MNVATAACVILQKRDVGEIFSRYLNHYGKKPSSVCLSPVAAANETRHFTHDPKRREELGVSGVGGHPGGRTRWEGKQAQVSAVWSPHMLITSERKAKHEKKKKKKKETRHFATIVLMALS